MGKFSYRSTNQRRRSLKYGGYQTITTLIVVALLILANVLFSLLDLNVDLTSLGLYTPGDQTREILDSLEDDIHIYGFYNKGSEDTETNARVIKLAEEYASLSDKVSYTTIDPLSNPSFANQFLSDDESSIDNGSLVVQNETSGKFRVVPQSSMYTTKSVSSYSDQTITGFTAEEALSSAIQYVILDKVPTLYELQGHGEKLLAGGFQDYLATSAFEIKTMNLISENIASIEGDVYTVIVVNAPTQDLLESEYNTLLAFIQDGGKLLFLASYNTPDLPYFQKLLSYFGLGYQSGIMAETDTSHYYMNPACIVPNASTESEITKNLYENNTSYVIMTLPAAVTVADAGTISSRVSIDQFLTTSEGAIMKGEGNKAATYEEGDTKGPFCLGAAAEEAINKDDGTVGYARIVVIGNSDFIDEDNGLVTTGNYRLMALVDDYMQDSTDSLYISGKNVTPYTISTTTSNFLVYMFVFAIAIPAAIIITGIVVWTRRKHL